MENLLIFFYILISVSLILIINVFKLCFNANFLSLDPMFRLNLNNVAAYRQNVESTSTDSWHVAVGLGNAKADRCSVRFGFRQPEPKANLSQCAYRRD